jgi:hypothetical protein
MIIYTGAIILAYKTSNQTSWKLDYFDNIPLADNRYNILKQRGFEITWNRIDVDKNGCIIRG